MALTNYGIPEEYKIRVKPQWDRHTPFSRPVYQRAVYVMAGGIAKQLEAKLLVDVGCGLGEKLMDASRGVATVTGLQARTTMDTLGLDTLSNIQRAHELFPTAAWVPEDFETCKGVWTSKPEAFYICADVIEHLLNPEPLAQRLVQCSRDGLGVLLSTPDRNRLGRRNGPPGNPRHVREWTLVELGRWLTSLGARIQASGHCRAHDGPKARMTCGWILMGREL